MMPAKKLTGLRFGRLVAIKQLSSRHKRACWGCLCDCGAAVSKSTANLTRGRVNSCGCKSIEHGSARRGQKSSEYLIWVSMRQRCSNPKNKSWHRYGGRGISVCDSWAESFEIFLADMGPRPSTNHSIERLDNAGDYRPGNCAWRTMQDQARNTRRNIIVKVDGRSMPLVQATELRGMPYKLVYDRMYRGWAFAKAITP